MSRGSDYLAAKEAAVRRAGQARELSVTDLDALRANAARAPSPPGFGSALRAGEYVALIAEFKRCSPSGGDLATSEDPAIAAAGFREAGAAALSVLTDPTDFGGSLEDLAAVSAAVTLPVLRKDFLVEELGLYEARLAGASAVLLILRILREGEVRRLIGHAAGVGLECLVEVHDEAELERALEVGASIVGINNRDLGDLRTDLAVTEQLAGRLPAGITLVAESGIRTPEDVGRMRDAGAHAVLVGESLLRLPPDGRTELAGALSQVRR